MDERSLNNEHACIWQLVAYIDTWTWNETGGKRENIYEPLINVEQVDRNSIKLPANSMTEVSAIYYCNG